MMKLVNNIVCYFIVDILSSKKIIHEGLSTNLNKISKELL